jgi:hypothetical protein
MQSDDNRVPAVEIVNVLPTRDEDVFDNVDFSSEATELDKKDIQSLFQSRNLAFISTLSKDGSPHNTPVWADMEEDLIFVNRPTTALVSTSG